MSSPEVERALTTYIKLQSYKEDLKLRIKTIKRGMWEPQNDSQKEIMAIQQTQLTTLERILKDVETILE